jgi:hypothetical protein
MSSSPPKESIKLSPNRSKASLRAFFTSKELDRIAGLINSFPEDARRSLPLCRSSCTEKEGKSNGGGGLLGSRHGLVSGECDGCQIGTRVKI